MDRRTYAMDRQPRLRLAGSKGGGRLIILCHGALSLYSATFKAEVGDVGGQIAAILARNNRSTPSRPVAAALKKAQEGSK